MLSNPETPEISNGFTPDGPLGVDLCPIYFPRTTLSEIPKHPIWGSPPNAMAFFLVFIYLFLPPAVNNANLDLFLGRYSPRWPASGIILFTGPLLLHGSCVLSPQHWSL